MESILFKLYQAAGCDLEAAQRGIVYLDEVDKKARKGKKAGGGMTRDVSG